MSLFRLDASIREEGSHSRAIADIVEQEWRNARPGEPIIRRHVEVDPIPATAWATAVDAGWTPEDSRTDEQKAALALAATLTGELVAADALLFAVPLNPALDQFADLARQLRQEAEAQARHHGRALSAAVPDAMAA
jgi:FMN-dependent NADH-azoreductase